MPRGKRMPTTKLPEFHMEQILMDQIKIQPFGGMTAKDLGWAVKQEHDFIEKVLNNCSDPKKTLPLFDQCVPILRQYFFENKWVVKGAGTRVVRGEVPDRMTAQIVFVEPSWDPNALCSQILRVYNHKQAMPVRIRILSLKDTIDVEIGKLLMEEIRRILKIPVDTLERPVKVLSSIDPKGIGIGPPLTIPPGVEKVLRERGLLGTPVTDLKA